MRKLSVAIVCGLCLLLSAQTRPTTQSANGFADYSISEPRIQDLKGFTYLHIDKKMAIRQMNAQVHPEVLKLEAAMQSQDTIATGPLVMIMHGMTANPDQPFAIQLGFGVNPGTAAPAGYVASNMPAKHFATIIYSGPIAQLGLAYQKLYPAIFGAGLMPTDESRMYYLYWEGVDSVNNVMMIAVEVQ